MQRSTVQNFSLLTEIGICSALFIYKSLIAFIFFFSFAPRTFATFGDTCSRPARAPMTRNAGGRAFNEAVS